MDKNQEMKTIVEEVVKALKKNGIAVDSAAILKMPDGETKGKENLIDEAVKNVFAKMKKQGFPMPEGLVVKPGTNEINEVLKAMTQAGNEADDKSKQCYCPDCFNFDTFENVLQPRGGSFDYAAVQLGGKNFNLKYWTDGKNENIMISPHKYTVDPTWSLDLCQEALNFAIGKKDYDTAQVLLDRITELKNQKGGE